MAHASLHKKSNYTSHELITLYTLQINAGRATSLKSSLDKGQVNLKILPVGHGQAKV